MKLHLLLTLILAFSSGAFANENKPYITMDKNHNFVTVKKSPEEIKAAREKYSVAKKAARSERKASISQAKEAMKAANNLPPEEIGAAVQAAHQMKREAMLKWRTTVKDLREQLWTELGLNKENPIAIGEPIKKELDQAKALVEARSKEAVARDSNAKLYNEGSLGEAVTAKATPSNAAQPEASEASRKPSSASRK